jgi:hypothetical protein
MVRREKVYINTMPETLIGTVASAGPCSLPSVGTASRNCARCKNCCQGGTRLRMAEDLFVLLEPMVDLIPVKSDVSFDALRIRNRALIAPGRVLAAAGRNIPIRSVAFERAMRAMSASFKQIALASDKGEE